MGFADFSNVSTVHQHFNVAVQKKRSSLYLDLLAGRLVHNHHVCITYAIFENPENPIDHRSSRKSSPSRFFQLDYNWCMAKELNKNGHPFLFNLCPIFDL